MDRALRPDAQPFDEVRIKTVPRYKTSGLSGDEWRISASIEFLRKGRVVHERGCGNVEAACGLLMGEWLRAVDEAKGYFAGEENFCDQEGCSEQATVTYRVKKQFARERPHEWNVAPMYPQVRKFCARHSKRGDCGFDDADANYEVVDGNVTEPSENDVSPSRLAGAIIFDPPQA